MATQGEEPTPTPQVVGNAFVEQYYTILAESPQAVHKFYQNSSEISRPDINGSMSSATTLEGIDKMILSLDYKDCRVEILTTDAQVSLGDGVLVLVTGFFTGKDNIKRRFTQAFFLAPQDSRSYYVLNDVFRYVDEEEATLIKISEADEIAPAAPVTPDPEPTLVSQHTELDQTTASLEEDNVQDEESSPTLDNGKISVDDEVVSSPSVGTSQNDGFPVPTGTGQSDANLVSEAVVSNVQEDAPKRSYASIANELNYKKQPFQQRILPAKPVQPVRVAVTPEASPRPVNNKPAEKNNTISVKGHSIFVANLPMSATIEDLIETFEKYGSIKPNGVQVRSYKLEKNCFGFVEFDSASSMQSAIEAKTVKIGDRLAHIEEKKANNEGVKFSSRRGGFRGDNFRNRGGRGFVRNELDNQGGLSGQSRGNPRRNGEANQKVYQNGGGRAARQAPAPAPTPTPAEAEAEAQGGKN